MIHKVAWPEAGPDGVNRRARGSGETLRARGKDSRTSGGGVGSGVGETGHPCSPIAHRYAPAHAARLRISPWADSLRSSSVYSPMTWPDVRSPVAANGL